MGSNPTPSAMRYIGIDYGEKRVGVALSDGNESFAFPETVFQNDANLEDNILSLIREKGIEALVIGDTRGSSGIQNPMTKEAEEFAHALARRTNLPLHFTKEIFSSIEASRYAPADDEHNDAAAAAIILQRFLDTPRAQR